jgi:drug/metabolite transporter (DMT)-like permease
MLPAPGKQLGSGSGVAALVLASAVFSWGFVFVKSTALPAPTIAFWRLVIGSSALLVAVLVLRPPRPASLAPVLAASLFFGVHQLLYVAATLNTSIAIVTLMGALQPLLIALVSRRLLGERVPTLLVMSSLAAIAGVGVVVWSNLDDPSRSLIGDLYSVANVLTGSVCFLLLKRARNEGTHTLTLTTSMLVGALVVVGPALFFVTPRLPITGEHWLLIAALALLPGNGHLLVNWALSRVSATLASLTLLAVPLLASIWAHLLFGEPYGLRHVVGMLLVALAVEAGRRAELRAPVVQSSGA